MRKSSTRLGLSSDGPETVLKQFGDQLMFERIFQRRCREPKPGPSQDEHAAEPVWGPSRPLHEFVAWLCQVDETDGLSRRQLWNLYGEFCLLTETEHLTQGQFFRQIKAAGVERYRESVGARPWRYRVRSASVVPLRVVGPEP